MKRLLCSTFSCALLFLSGSALSACILQNVSLPTKPYSAIEDSFTSFSFDVVCDHVPDAYFLSLDTLHGFFTPDDQSFKFSLPGKNGASLDGFIRAASPALNGTVPGSAYTGSQHFQFSVFFPRGQWNVSAVLPTSISLSLFPAKVN